MYSNINIAHFHLQVAPRAKMNQQRSRRFRSSKEAEKLAATILARDGSLPERDAFDSNCITPGTDFMLKLGLAMRKWIQYKQETDPAWKNGCDVVVSGPDVPGEGEHKVRMKWISLLLMHSIMFFPSQFHSICPHTWIKGYGLHP